MPSIRFEAAANGSLGSDAPHDAIAECPVDFSTDKRRLDILSNAFALRLRWFFLRMERPTGVAGTTGGREEPLEVRAFDMLVRVCASAWYKEGGRDLIERFVGVAPNRG